MVARRVPRAGDAGALNPEPWLGLSLLAALSDPADSLVLETSVKPSGWASLSD